MIRCQTDSFKIICQNCNDITFPYLRDANGDRKMWCVSPHHGRSFVVGRTKNGKFVVSKGNGLSYTSHNLIYTPEFGNDTYGLLLKRDAIRDFVLGIEIEALGIKTNHMQYVLELEREIMLGNGTILKPVLLQYTVECPYRICDAAYMDKKIIHEFTARWEKFNIHGYKKAHLIAAEVLVNNLRVLHDNQILHNAIHYQNYTWALELLDFELSCSPTHPYDREDYRRHVQSLYPREIIQTYEIINHIAWCLREDIDFTEIDAIFKSFDFDLAKMCVKLL